MNNGILVKQFNLDYVTELENKNVYLLVLHFRVFI